MRAAVFGGGLLGFSIGIQVAFPNPTVHDRTQMSAHDAAERLASLSLLANWVEQCDLDSADDE